MRLALTFACLLVASGCSCVDTVMTSNNCTGGKCSAADGSVRDGGSSADASTGGAADSGTQSGLDAGSSPFDVVSIEVTPSVAVLTPGIGQRLTQTFTAQLVRRNGERASALLAWSQDSLVAGDLDPNSAIFTTNGLVGAQVKITATYIEHGMPVTGEATLTVRAQAVSFATSTPSDSATKFANMQTPNNESADIAYPLDNAVMPQNVYAADIQWLKGEQGDLFRISLTKSNISITNYILHTGSGFTNHWLVDEAAWRALAQTNPDELATIRVDRYVASQSIAVSSNPIRIRFARAALSGSVYYWAISEGHVYRIDDGTNNRVNFMPKPPVMQEPGGTSQCIGCHSISPSGRYMAGRMGGGVNFATVFDLTANLTTDPPPSLFPTDKVQNWFSTWNPSETRLMTTAGWPPPVHMSLLDPHTGNEIATSGAALPINDNPAHPDWSPDGTSIAYVGHDPSEDWGVDYRVSDLRLLPVTGPDTFGNATTLLRGGDVPGHLPEEQAISYPVWTPDSKRLVFAHGFSGRSASGPGKLLIINKDGSGIRSLDKANGSARDSYEPRFSPFDSGGYYWLAFLTRRDYGNAVVGSRGTQLAQIWVTAIKKNPAPGEDPSEVGYWLPGQNPKSASISAYWAPRACRATGTACGVGSECCSGDCRPPAGGGATICSPPPAERCRIDGQTCGGTGECCAGLDCEQNVCRQPIF